MNQTTNHIHPQTEKGELVSQIIFWNDQLESAISLSTNRAFNLGCFVGLFPAAALILLTYLFAGRSWVGAIVMLVLMTLALLLFANVVAGIARNNTLQRFYQEEIQPEIERTLQRDQMDYLDFAVIATESLATGSVLLIAISKQNDPTGPNQV